ncbi:hypothetical protein PMAYCL1PPCAC_03473 [Pristionchus mayeri]|uniref:G-protein coupled receptors family 1 profile domain-containing protein n=1 Tax=Pristionchus mayeri TaxID=1317129 RepID=A0AAN4Z361_9BILA|nr:hypothetical protein PMAYCL1PPCAC_03473 [Pristionchus mayeri]
MEDEYPTNPLELMKWNITDQASSRRLVEALATFGVEPPITPPINMSFHAQFPAAGYNSGRPFLMWIAAFYGMLFIIGTCGNVAILAIVHYVKNDNSKHRMRHNTTLTYLSVLCITDFLSMMPLPMTIMDQILGFWIFGSYACKLSRLLEHISKIFSNFILVAFSVDRYLAVCHPLRTNLRAPSKVYLILGAVFLISCSLVSPMIYNAKTKSFGMEQQYYNQTNTLVVLFCNKCVDDMPQQTFYAFIITAFIIAYFLPFCLLIYFYYAMLARLFQQSKMSKGLRGKRIDEKIPVFRIACYTLAICFFHFLCWTPYWMSVVYQLFREFYTVDPTSVEANVVYIMYLIHALPYVNSASNFVLYGLLNRQLQQHRGGRRGHGTIVSTTLPPTLKFTECTEDKANGHAGHHSAPVTESMAARTPPSTPCRSDFNGNGKVCGEKSPLIKGCEKNGAVVIASRTPISEFKLDDGESIMI